MNMCNKIEAFAWEKYLQSCMYLKFSTFYSCMEMFKVTKDKTKAFYSILWHILSVVDFLLSLLK